MPHLIDFSKLFFHNLNVLKRASATSEKGQRNRTVDLEMEQQQQQSQSSSQQQVDDDDDMSASPFFPNLESLSLEEPAYDNSPVFYGLPQYHHPTNFYAPYVTFPPPPNQLPSPTDFYVNDHEYERNAHFMDQTRGTYKRKNTEGIPYQYHTSSETVAPFGSLRNRPGAAVTTMNLDFPPYVPNSFIHGNYAAPHPFPPPPGSILYEQHFRRADAFWPHTHYIHRGNIGNHTGFMYPSHLNPRDHYHYHHHHQTPLPIQGMRGQSVTFYPHMASLDSYRVPFGSFAPHNAMNSVPSSSEMGLVQYQHHQGDDSVPVATLRQHNGGLPRVRLMPDDEVAMLQFGDFGSGNNLTIDQHRDMRLDIEGMSYEDIRALTDRIGTVNTGLPEEDVKNHLKTRTYSGINHEEESPKAKETETESCTICQESFKNEEKIARLNCGHEYHTECLVKWLIVKNICPICKSEALVIEKKKD